jgi:hypothetical protein
MCVVAANESLPPWRMQSEGVPEPVRPDFSRLDAANLELRKIAAFIPVAATIEVQQKLQRVLDLLRGVRSERDVRHQHEGAVVRRTRRHFWALRARSRIGQISTRGVMSDSKRK